MIEIIPKETVLYRSSINSLDRSVFCNDTKKIGLYFSDNIILPLNMIFEYKNLSLKLYECKLLKDEICTIGKYGFRYLDPYYYKNDLPSTEFLQKFLPLDANVNLSTMPLKNSSHNVSHIMKDISAIVTDTKYKKIEDISCIEIFLSDNFSSPLKEKFVIEKIYSICDKISFDDLYEVIMSKKDLTINSLLSDNIIY